MLADSAHWQEAARLAGPMAASTALSSFSAVKGFDNKGNPRSTTKRRTAHARRYHVREKQTDLIGALAKQAQRALTGIRQKDFIAGGRKDDADELAHRDFIVHHQDGAAESVGEGRFHADAMTNASPGEANAWPDRMCDLVDKTPPDLLSSKEYCPVAVGKLVKLQHGPATVSVEAGSR